MTSPAWTYSNVLGSRRLRDEEATDFADFYSVQVDLAYRGPLQIAVELIDRSGVVLSREEVGFTLAP
jgi:hypothetical protein